MNKIFYCLACILFLASCSSGRKGEESDSMAESQESDSGYVLGKSEEELISATIKPIRHQDPRAGENEVREAEVGDDGKVKTLPSNGRPTLLDFTATWCPPCRMMKPVFKDLEDTYDDRMNFVTIDIDVNPALATLYNISAVPTFIFLDSSGKKVKVVEGAVGQDVLENQINRMITR
ncbi:MAG: thioredoxin family protein [Muribaculaceae bacterium]|nr:thioredoxin family protein [Muribaculaceae bacterium]